MDYDKFKKINRLSYISKNALFLDVSPQLYSTAQDPKQEKGDVEENLVAISSKLKGHREASI